MLFLYTDWLALGTCESLIDLIGGLLCAWVATENALVLNNLCTLTEYDLIEDYTKTRLANWSQL